MKLTDHCFAVLGFRYYLSWGVNTGFIVGGSATLIVDAGPTYITAKTVHGYTQNVKPENELIVINTEKHLDHIGGNSFFADKGIKIFGYELINTINESKAPTA